MARYNHEIKNPHVIKMGKNIRDINGLFGKNNQHIRTDVIEWILINVVEDWNWEFGDQNGATFNFSNIDDSIIFKMAWE